MAEYPCTNCPDCEEYTVSQCDGIVIATGFPNSTVTVTKGAGLMLTGVSDVLGNITLPDAFPDNENYFTQYAGIITVAVVPDLQLPPEACWRLRYIP